MDDYIKRQMVTVLKKNRVITCSDKIVPAKNNKVNINSALIVGRKEQNVGDMLSEYIVRFVANWYHIDWDKEVRKTRHLYAVGSVLGGGVSGCYSMGFWLSNRYNF